MTERFFFDLTDGLSTIRDEEGVLAADLDDAVRQAGEVLEDMSENDEFADGDEGWVMIIRHAAGETRRVLPVVPRERRAAVAS